MGAKPRCELTVCDTARKAIVVTRYRTLNAELTTGTVALDGHALLTRLKVAALLAILCRGDDKITDEDWSLAGCVMETSDATRQVCADALASKTRAANVTRAHLEADREEVRADREEKRAARAILARLRAVPGWRSAGAIRRELDSKLREHFEPGMTRVLEAGQAERRGDGERAEYRNPWV